MSGAVRITLPSAVAEELISEGEVVPSLMTRSVGDVLQIVVDVANTGGSAVTVAAAATAVPKVMRRVGAHARRRQPNGPARVVLRSADRDLVIEIPPELSIDDVGQLLARWFDDASNGALG